MAIRDKSFTLKVIPHNATRNSKEWIISGRKLLAFRIIFVLLFVLIAGSIVVISVGTSEFTKTAELREQNNLLLDSLVQARELNTRLDVIEIELQAIRATRAIIENLATTGGPATDPE